MSTTGSRLIVLALAGAMVTTMAGCEPWEDQSAKNRVSNPLDDWLAGRPAIANAIVWREASVGQAAVCYRDWSAARKEDLYAMFELIRAGESPGLPAAPMNLRTFEPDQHVFTVLEPELAWDYYRGFVAQSLSLEYKGALPWSLADCDPDALAVLLDSSFMFDCRVDTCAVNWVDLGSVTPGDPVRIHRFLRENDLIGDSQDDTIARLLDWCRQNLLHHFGARDPENVYDQWQYLGYPPVEYTINGTPCLSVPDWGVQHRVMGCHGTVGFLSLVLRTVNIPVECVQVHGHALPHFVRQGVYLSHGDDVYDDLAYGDYAVTEMLIDQETFDHWFGSDVPDDEQCRNIGRRVRELAIQHLPNNLLAMHCRDVSQGDTGAASSVYRSLAWTWNDSPGLFTVSELEAEGLWERMDNAIEALGGCENVEWRNRPAVGDGAGAGPAL